MPTEASRSFFALSPAEARERFTALGAKPFHADVVRREVLANGVLDYASMSGLSKSLRERLPEELPLLAGREVARSHASDGTTKLLIALDRGGTVETVHMPSRTKPGATLCVSTQVGCPVGCPFCASGRAGLERNLGPEEILEQYLRGRAIGPLSRSVVMGIGEPLLNYEALDAALDVVRGELGLGARKITVSTVGFPNRLRRLAPERPGFQLAISLHSPDDDQRAELVPAMKDVRIAELLDAGDDWFEQTGREVTYEYVLLGGHNDTPGHARRLIERLARRRATLNLIPYNPVQGDRFERPNAERVRAFHEALTAGGLVATVRWSRGVEADAACGQLRIRIGQDAVETEPDAP